MARKRAHVKVTLSIENADRNPIGALRGINKATKSIQATVPDIVAMARAQRCTWAEIGDALGITRQAAWERFSTD